MSKSRVDVLPMSIPTAPMQSSSIASRCLCMTCGKQPQVIASGEGPVRLAVSCCGNSETRYVSKDELLFTQKFFGAEDDED